VIGRFVRSPGKHTKIKEKERKVMSTNVAPEAPTGSQQACPESGEFCWNELLASDTGAAAKFYTQLFGWRTEAFQGGMNYTLFKQNGDRIAGLMERPDKQVPPHWLSYVEVESVEASAKRAGDLGARIMMPPTDIPTVGKIAVFQDPQGAALAIFQPTKK